MTGEVNPSAVRRDVTDRPFELEVRAPSRLHFGLFAFESRSAGRSFGGAGAMVDSPGVRLGVSHSDAFVASGPCSARVVDFAQRLCESFKWREPPACRVHVLVAPRQHSGLGLGTQLGMAVATALTRWRDPDQQPVERLAPAVGRGRRSTVGVHGFQRGGLIVDSGHADGGRLGGVEAHTAFPDAWRWVLIVDRRDVGLAGQAERDAFSVAPPVPDETTERLRRLALDVMTPAAREADYGRFAAAVYEYGVTAGGCFAAVQGGSFASEAIRRRVDLARTLGHEGCGQTSWGPTVFALAPSPESASNLAQRLRQEPEVAGCDVLIARPNNSGATVLVRRRDAVLEESVL